MYNELAYLTSFLAFNETLNGLFTKISLIAIVSYIYIYFILFCFFLIQDSKFSKALPQAEPIRLTNTCLALPKMFFTWPLVINAIFST